MVSSNAKMISIALRAELTAEDEAAACHSPKREPRLSGLPRFSLNLEAAFSARVDVLRTNPSLARH
jgi:hypothetical protein